MVRSFSVTKVSEAFVKPCEPTPTETVCLSSMDVVPSFHHMVPSLHVFKHGEEAAKVIKEALSRALVKYYPLAGRFVKTEDDDLAVACTAEGVLFIEATADCHLEDVEYFDLPVTMIPLEDLLPVASAEPNPEITVPFMFQVTSFTCGGFVLGISSCHTITDGLGAGQFITAIAEHSRGLLAPTVDPVWLRETIPDPHKLQGLPKQPPVEALTLPPWRLHYATVDISLENINKVKSQYFKISNGVHCSAFDVALAKLWQARTRAINYENPEHEVRASFFANIRPYLDELKKKQAEFYGNAFYTMTARSTAGFIAKSELVEVVKVVRGAKAKLIEEFGQWARGELNDIFELKFDYDSLFVSDWTKLGFHEADFGWGKPVNVVPLGLQKFVVKGLLTAPPTPKKGLRWTTLVVNVEHLPKFVEEMNKFED